MGNSVVADKFGSRFIYLIYTHDGAKTQGDEGIETDRLILRSVPITQTSSLPLLSKRTLKFNFFSYF